MEKQFEDYQSVIEYEFNIRNKRNPKYSLRAYARDLGLTPSQLSEVLSYKQGLSTQKAVTIAKKLGYRDRKITWFRCLVEAQHARSKQRREEAKKKLSNYSNGVETREASIDSLNFTLNWFHLAIRRMVNMPAFKLEPEWISQKLGISKRVSQAAISDLIEAGLIKVDPDNKVTSIENLSFNTDQKSSRFADKFYQQILYKAYRARKIFEPHRRKQGLHLLTIDNKLLPELFDLIQEFEDRLDHLTYKSQKHDELMVVTFQAFPLLLDQSKES